MKLPAWWPFGAEAKRRSEEAYERGLLWCGCHIAASSARLHEFKAVTLTSGETMFESFCPAMRKVKREPMKVVQGDYRRARRVQAILTAADHLRRRAACDDCSWDELQRLSREYDVARAALEPEDLA